MKEITSLGSSFNFNLDFYPFEKTKMIFIANEVKPREWTAFIVNVDHKEILSSEKHKIQQEIEKQIRDYLGDLEHFIIDLRFTLYA